MEPRKPLPPPTKPPNSNGCLIAVLICLVLLLIGWSMCGGGYEVSQQ